jgi:hypothetical protein
MCVQEVYVQCNMYVWLLVNCNISKISYVYTPITTMLTKVTTILKIVTTMLKTFTTNCSQRTNEVYTVKGPNGIENLFYEYKENMNNRLNMRTLLDISLLQNG